MTTSPAAFSFPALPVRPFPRPTRRSTRMSAQPNRRYKTLADITKYSISVAVGTSLLYNHDAPTLFYVGSSIVNSVTGKALKLLIREPRPDGSSKGDPGMPSSHATSLSFLSLGLFGYFLMYVDSTPKTICTGCLIALAALATYWRVSAGYHTVPQVVAGWLVGSFNAAIFILLVPWVVPYLKVVLDGKELLSTLAITGVCNSLFVLSSNLPSMFQCTFFPLSPRIHQILTMTNIESMSSGVCLLHFGSRCSQISEQDIAAATITCPSTFLFLRDFAVER